MSPACPQRTGPGPRIAPFLLALAGCASHEPAPADRVEHARTGAEAALRPTLEEVFLIPGVHGEPPRSVALSADGDWLLFDWRPLIEDEHGDLALAPRTPPRLLSTRAPETFDHRGRPLDQVLAAALARGGAGPGSALEEPTELDAQAESEAARLVHAFSFEGAQLAVATPQRVYLLSPPAVGADDPEAWTAELALALEPPSASEETGAERATGDAERSAGRLTAVRALAFERPRDGSARRMLVVSGGAARLAFDLDAPRPWRLADASPASRELSGAGQLQWSEDRAVAFAENEPLAWIEVGTERVLEAPPPSEDQGEASVEQKSEDTAESAASDEGARAGDALERGDAREARVWRASDDRFVTLEGYERDGRASLSPCGRFVLQTLTDEDAGPPPTLVPDYLTERVSTRPARRQWADDLAPPARTLVFDAQSGERAELAFPDLPAVAAAAPDGGGRPAPDGPARELPWSTPLGWAPWPPAADGTERPARFAWMRLTPDFRTMRLFVWSSEAGPSSDAGATAAHAWTEPLFELTDPRWYGGPASLPAWTPDGERLLVALEATPLSLSPDRAQLFAIEVASGRVRQLTEVAGEVSSFDVLDDGSVVFVASEADPRRRTIGLLPAAAVRGELGGTRSAARLLPLPVGWNDSPTVSADGSTLVFAHQRVGQPAELLRFDLDDPTAEAEPLTDTEPEVYRAIDWIRPLPFAAQHEDGTRVHAHVFLPPGVELGRPGRARPAVVFIHGAGYLQNVTDSMTRYEVNLLFHSRLARLGYVVVDVDYRGSAGYGNAFRTDVQYALGALELADIHLVLDALAERGVVDPERVACYGGSYGGFLTLMALFTAPERWVAGAALRSVTDWRTYHPRYTQPRLGRPSTHAEAYARSSPIDLVEGLEDPLLVLHGLVDSNVFAQDSIRLIERLIDLGKDFDAMLYPSQGHTFDDGMHWLDEYRRIERFLTGHLGRP